MNKMRSVIVVLTVLCLNHLSAQPQNYSSAPTTMPSDCTDLDSDEQQFALQLNSSNKTMFCSKFNDAQRSQAMQYASQQNALGNPMMTPDQAVQKVATDNNLTTPSQKTPTGCPVK